jgi:hypothetical protein
VTKKEFGMIKKMFGEKKELGVIKRRARDNKRVEQKYES